MQWAGVSGDNLVLAGLGALPPLAAAGLWRLRRAVRSTEKPGAGLILLGNALLLGLLLASAALAGEVYFRFVCDETDSFMVTKTMHKWMRRHWVLNAAGYRDDVEYPARHTPGRRRITFVGDSFTAGHGVKDVGDRFVNLLRRRHPEWEVHMFAALGADTGEEITKLESSFGRGYELEDVVLVYCLNDLGDLVQEWLHELDAFSDAWSHRSWLRRHSFLVDTLAHRIGLRTSPVTGGYYEFVQAAYANSTWELQKERLIQLQRVVQDRGGRLLVVTFPFLHDLGPDYPFRGVHAQLDAFWTERGVDHLDLLPTFEGTSPEELVVGPRDAHPNPRAHAMAADAIERWLAER